MATKADTDATHILAADHRKVEEIFASFEKARGKDRKQALAEQACLELKVHTIVEEEIFYPAVESVLPHATPEHAAMKAMVAHIQSLEPVAEHVDGPIQVLAQTVNEHVSDLHTSLFPRVKASDIDLEELGHRMARRKAELIAELT